MDDFSGIKEILSTQFEKDLFDASLKNLEDQTNKLRYNNFAYSMRELSRHFLHTLAPESKVKSCKWFKCETENGLPTRAQRIKYAIQGGIVDEILDEWGFDIENLKEVSKTIIKEINSLSVYTHINENVFDLDIVEVERNSDAILSAFKVFVETISNYREEIKSFLDGFVEEHIISSTVSNFFANIDCLAPHYTLDECSITDFNISEVDDSEIIVDVNGYIGVTLEYGSRKERREGDGLNVEESFPFSTKIRYSIDFDFPSKNYEIDEYDVDTSEWYGEY